MTEGNILTEGATGPVLSFSERIKALTETQNQQPAKLTDPRLKGIAAIAQLPHNQTVKGLESLLSKGDNLLIDPKNNVPIDQWKALSSEIAQERDKKKMQEPKKESAIEKAYKGKTEDEFLETVFSMDEIAFIKGQEGMISPQEWFTAPDPEWPEKQDYYRAVVLLTNAAYDKTTRGASLDVLIPRVTSAGERSFEPEIAKMTKEQLILLLNTPGVDWCLTEYARLIVLHRKIVYGWKVSEDGQRVPLSTTIEGCLDDKVLFAVRKEIRRRLKEGCPNPNSDSEKRRRKHLNERGITELTEREASIAESISYLLIYCGGLIESSDTPNTAPCRPETLRKIAKVDGWPKDPVPVIGTEQGKEIVKALNFQFEQGQEEEVPNTEMISKVGLTPLRELCNPLARALTKMNEKGPRHEGWGAYKAWINAQIAKGALDNIKRVLPEIYPDKLGMSWFENTKETINKRLPNEEKIPIIEKILLGESYRPARENPFSGWYTELGRRKGIFDIISASSSASQKKIDLKGAGYAAGEQVGSSILELLERLDLLNDTKLVRQIALAMYHDERGDSIRWGYGLNTIAAGAFNRGLRSVGIQING